MRTTPSPLLALQQARRTDRRFNLKISVGDADTQLERTTWRCVLAGVFIPGPRTRRARHGARSDRFHTDQPSPHDTTDLGAGRQLYPRALLTPFTDNVVLTEADQKAYAAYAKSQRHKGFQSVEVTFEDRKPKPPPAK